MISESTTGGLSEKHVILCGLDRLGLRTLEQLCAAGATVCVIAEPDSSPPTRIEARFVTGDPREPSTLRLAGIERASAVVLTGDDDVVNLHAALAARELNPEVVTVVRVFNTELAAQLESLLPECRLLSASALAAPAFVAALGLLDSAVTRRSTGRARTAELRATVRGLARDGRFRVLIGLFIATVAVSTIVFTRLDGLTPIDAAYFTVTTAMTTEYGDIDLFEAAWWFKLYGVLLMLVGAAMIAALYAFLTDALVSSRIARALGQVPRGLRDHVVVAGVGSVGYRIVQQLVAAGLPVAAIERNEHSTFVPAARALRVPLVTGDASLSQTLAAVHVERALCLLSVTDDDVVNLQAALSARAVAPNLPIVVRLFDDDLAERVERTLGIRSRSMSAIAAPAFAAAALDQRAAGGNPSPQPLLE